MRTAPTDTDPEETLMERMGLDVLSPEVTATGRRHTEQYGRGSLRTERATGTYDGPSEQGETEPEGGEKTDLPLLEADRTGRVEFPDGDLAYTNLESPISKVSDKRKRPNAEPEYLVEYADGLCYCATFEIDRLRLVYYCSRRQPRVDYTCVSVPTAGSAFQGRFQDRGRPRSQETVRRLFRSPQGRQQPVAVDESWTYGRPTGPAPDSTAPTDVPAAEKEDVDMGETDVYLHNAPALPKHPTFKGSTKEKRRTFMAAYNLYISQTTAITVNGTEPFVMPDPYEVTEAEWVAWFRQGYDVDPRALDTLKKRIKAAVVFDMSVQDADSRIGKMLDGLAAAIRRDRQEWVIKEESPAIVKIITDAVKPVSLHRAVTEQMALTRNKPLKKDVYRFVRWLREYAIGHERFVGYEASCEAGSAQDEPRRYTRTPYGSDSVDTTGTSDSDDAPGTTWADVSERLSEVQVYEPSRTGVPGYHRRGSSEAPQGTRTNPRPWTERR
ncbi:hypothetical protein DYB28_001383 [Aphanomyces astaci]|uniref:Uncharacterized protein n=1 Tax=Aphanomyces astaci TaxID=112090 RepID=A0A9X8H409_APHAT|nr:hypothetical protein DYB28_001383 [Aphanomyces astaci]